MNEYFYYFGFLYLIYSINKVLDTLKPIDKESALHINDKMDVVELMDMAKNHNEKNKFNPFNSIAGTIFLIWSMVGYKSNSPEKYLFLWDIIFTICHWSFIFYIGIHFAFKAFFKNKSEISNEVKQPTISIPFSKIANMVELSIVSLILYIHFFTN